MRITTGKRFCRKCGAAIPPDSPEHSCGACLLETGLDQAEFDERVDRAMNAKTRADLAGLFDDLPETGAPAVPERPRHRRRHPILTIALLVLITVAAVHAVAAVFVPWLWIGFLAVILLFATGTIGHSRHSHDHLRTGDSEHRPGI